MYADVAALGAIFGVPQRADALIDGFRKQLPAVTDRLKAVRSTPRVMYCGDCSSTGAPLSSGAEGMPALIAKLAGGSNIFDDIPNSYVRVNWEDVVQRNPEWILISDDRLPASRQIAHLLRNPLADPYLFGISSGATVGAVSVIVYGATAAGPFALPLAAFVGALLAMVFVFAAVRTPAGNSGERLVMTPVWPWRSSCRPPPTS